MEIITQSAQNTQKLGQKIAADLIQKKETILPHIILLYGELGSGKTTFIQGLAQGFGLLHRIVSPTFMISKRYTLENKYFKWLYHMDLYRINESNLSDLGLTEIFANSSNLVVIEWAEKLGDKLPKNAIKIKFEIIEEDKRKITINYE